jgi:uncharacterized protein YjeT (DUF2065 family)
MTATLLIGAIALVFVFEGLMPFFSPSLWRRIFEKALTMSDGQLRFVGLTSMLVGLAILVVFLG